MNETQQSGGVLRRLTNKERRGRGCDICADMVRATRQTHPEEERENKGDRLLYCPFEECPYHELDGISNYLDYDLAVEEDWKKAFARFIGEVRA